MDVMTLAAKLALDSSEYDSGLSKAVSKMSSFGSALKSGFGAIAKIGGVALTAATAAVTGFAASSIKAGATFDSSMSQVAATLGLTMSEMESTVGSVETTFGKFEGNLRDFAQFMGQNTAFSASEAADALNYMALAGYNAQQSMDMLPNVLNLAAAGNMDLARASDMVTDSQSALGLSFDQTNTLVDQMAKAASKSNTSVEQLGEAILTVGGTAKNLVGGTTELNTALGILADNGIKGAEGGTKLRNMITSLTAPTDKAGALMKELGVSAFDADGNMRPLNETFADLGEVMSSMTQEGRMQTLSELFNARDIKAAEAMLANYGDRWNELSGYIDDAEGAAAQMAATQLDNLNGDITLFKSALEGAQIAISDQLTPSLREFVQFGTKGLSELTSAFQEGGLAGAMDKLGELMSEGLNMIVEAAPKAVEAGLELLGALGKGIADNAPQIFSATGQVGGLLLGAINDLARETAYALVDFDWVGAASGLGEKISGMFDPSNLHDLVGGLASKALFIVEALANGISESIPALVPAANDLITNLGKFIADEAPDLIDSGINLLYSLCTGISETLPTLIPTVVETLLSVIDDFLSGDGIDKMADAGVSFITNLADGIAKAIPIFIEKAPEILGKLLDALLRNAPKILEAAIYFITTLGSSLLEAASPLIEKGGEIIENIKTGIQEKFADIKAAGSELIENIKAGIQEKIDAVKQAISDMWTAILNNPIVAAIVKYVSSTFENMKKTLAGIWDGIKTYASSAWELVKNVILGPVLLLIDLVTGNFTKLKEDAANIWQNIKEAAVGMWTGLKNTVVSLVVGLWTQVKTNFTTMKDGVVSLVTNTKDKAIELWANLKNKVTETASNLISSVRTKISELPGIIKTKFDEAVGFIKDLPGKALEWGKDMIGNFIDGIKQKWEDLKNNLSVTADTIRSFLGFSEPEEGPLSNFHTYAPDMMKLFAEGIKNNTRLVTDQIEKSFDFSNAITAPEGGSRSYTGGSIVMNIYGAEGQSVQELADIVMDRMQHKYDMGAAVYA